MASWLRALRPPRGLSRGLCTDAAEASKAELELFLKRASRPILGQAKAKTSSGQKVLDLTKQMSRLQDLTLPELCKVKGEELKRRGLPVQERKRLLRYTAKQRTGWTWMPAAHSNPNAPDGGFTKHVWRGWIPPTSESMGVKPGQYTWKLK